MDYEALKHEQSEKIIEYKEILEGFDTDFVRMREDYNEHLKALVSTAYDIIQEVFGLHKDIDRIEFTLSDTYEPKKINHTLKASIHCADATLFNFDTFYLNSNNTWKMLEKALSNTMTIASNNYNHHFIINRDVRLIDLEHFFGL